MDAIGTMGFIFGLVAIGIVEPLRRSVSKMKQEVESIKEDLATLKGQSG